MGGRVLFDFVEKVSDFLFGKFPGTLFLKQGNVHAEAFFYIVWNNPVYMGRVTKVIPLKEIVPIMGNLVLDYLGLICNY